MDDEVKADAGASDVVHAFLVKTGWVVLCGGLGLLLFALGNCSPPSFYCQAAGVLLIVLANFMAAGFLLAWISDLFFTPEQCTTLGRAARIVIAFPLGFVILHWLVVGIGFMLPRG